MQAKDFTEISFADAADQNSYGEIEEYNPGNFLEAFVEVVTHEARQYGLTPSEMMVAGALGETM